MEKKVRTASHNGDAFNNSTVSLLDGITQGIDFDNRIGNVITITSIQLHFEVYANPPTATGVSRRTGRVMIVIDKQPKGVLGTFANLNENASDPLSFRHLDNRHRFQTVWNSGIWPISDNTGNKDYHHTWSFYCDCNIPVIYQGTTNAIGDITTNSLLLFIQIDTATTTQFDYNGRSRIRFIDGRKPGGIKIWKRSIKSDLRMGTQV